MVEVGLKPPPLAQESEALPQGYGAPPHWGMDPGVGVHGENANPPR